MISIEGVKFTNQNDGWTYGVWYCGTSYTKVVLHGQYPPTFLKRALALFPEAKDVLHCPSGILGPPWFDDRNHVTVDAVVDEVTRPQIQADAASMPMLANGSFDLVLSDPPYTEMDSAVYEQNPFPMVRFMREAHRVLRPEGYLGVLDLRYPVFHRKNWDLVGLIAIVTGFGRLTRIFSIFQKRGTVFTDTRKKTRYPQHAPL